MNTALKDLISSLYIRPYFCIYLIHEGENRLIAAFPRLHYLTMIDMCVLFDST